MGKTHESHRKSSWDHEIKKKVEALGGEINPNILSGP